MSPVIPFLNNAASLAASRSVYYPTLMLSQLNNVFYAFRDAARNETVIPSERYIDYGVKGYLGTMIMAYTYELGFRMIDALFTAPNMARALGFDELSRWYSKPGQPSQKALDVRSINQIKSVAEHMFSAGSKKEGHAIFAQQAFDVYHSKANGAKLTDAERTVMKENLPKVLEYLRKMRYFDYRGKDYINYILANANSQNFINEELHQYAMMRNVPKLEGQDLERGVHLLRQLMGEAEASTKLIEGIVKEPPVKISVLPKWLSKKSTEQLEATIEELCKLKPDDLKKVDLTVNQRLQILKSIDFNSNDIKAWHQLSPLQMKLIKPILGHYNLVNIDKLDDAHNELVHRAILNTKKAFEDIDSLEAYKKILARHRNEYKEQLSVLEHLAKGEPLPKTKHIDAQKFKNLFNERIAKKIGQGFDGYSYKDLLKKWQSEEMTWVERQVKELIAPFTESSKPLSQIAERTKALFKGDTLKTAQHWLNHYVGEGFKSWRVQRELTKIASSETWPKLLLTTAMNFVAHGFFLSIAEIKWAQKLEKELVAEGIAPDKVFRGPMYGGLIPALAIYASMMWQTATQRIPVLGKYITKMSRLTRHAVAGALGLAAYGAVVIGGTYHNIKKERRKVGQSHHYHPVVAPHHRETRLDPISFNQFVHGHINNGQASSSRYAKNPFVTATT